jgi:small-conductance mechanosensitive channel
LIVDVGVSYNSNLDDVIRCLREVADGNENVLKQPEPDVLLSSFGDSSWNMKLRVWLKNPQNYYKIHSDINCEIVRKFRQNAIEIPFPQRDLHVRSAVPIPFNPIEH